MRAERESPGRFFSRDVVREDRRRVVGTPTTRTATEFVDQLETWFDLSDSPPAFSVTEAIAVRGELCALIRCQLGFGDTATEVLNVFRNVARDVVQKSVPFDPDDLDAALAELEQLQAESDDPEPSS